MKPEDEARLQHILDSADKILEIYSEVDFRKFSEDWRSQDLMIRHFEIIGEAAKHLSEELRNEYDDVEWRCDGNAEPPDPSVFRSGCCHSLEYGELGFEAF